MEPRDYFNQDETLSLKNRIQELEEDNKRLKKEIDRINEKMLSNNKINENHVNTLVRQLENYKYTEK